MKNQPGSYDAEMRARLWEHRAATNQDFSVFANFFLVAESILLATAGSTLGNTSAPRLVLYALTALGLVLTVVWTIVQAKQSRLLSQLKARCERELPEYRETRIARGGFLAKFSNIWLLTYFVPSVFATAWLCIAYAILFNIDA